MLALSIDSTPQQTPRPPIALTRTAHRRARLLLVRLLLTNDDGIESEGLHVLAAAMADAGHEVVIAAPDQDYSGAGASIGRISTDDTISVQRVEVPGCAGIPAFAIGGPPGLCVVAARLGALGDLGFHDPALEPKAPPWYVVSGTNAGANTARSILHSGTVGACLTAQNFGVSGLAVSVAWAEPWQWHTAARLAVDVLPMLEDAPDRTVLNLNVPALPYDEVLGIRWARLAPFGSVRFAVTEQGRQTSGTKLDPGETIGLELELIATDYQPPSDTDQAIIQAGYAALTTLVGVAEAWDPDHDGVAGALADDVDLSEVTEESAPAADEPPAHLRGRVVPGASLHPVHRIPDASDRRTLHRPEVASDPIAPLPK